MKRIILLLCIAVMLAALLTACKGNAVSNPTQAAEPMTEKPRPTVIATQAAEKPTDAVEELMTEIKENVDSMIDNGEVEDGDGNVGIAENHDGDGNIDENAVDDE